MFSKNSGEQPEQIANHAGMVEVRQSQMFAVKIVVGILRHYPEKWQQQQTEKLEGKQDRNERMLFVKTADKVHVLVIVKAIKKGRLFNQPFLYVTLKSSLNLITYRFFRNINISRIKHGRVKQNPSLGNITAGSWNIKPVLFIYKQV